MKEYGGYLPLEIHRGTEWYTEDETDLGIARLNSGRSALWLAMRHLGAERLFVPVYYCPTVVQSLRDDGFEVVFYPIDRQLLPRLEDVRLESKDAVLLVNYFGLIRDHLVDAAERFKKVIFDNALAFYAEPVAREGVVSVYSCRKFFGVSDGAYAIGVGVVQPVLPQDVSSYHANHLLLSFELGTNSAYRESLQNEERLMSEHLSMSKLTRRLLCGADYEAVRDRRRANYELLRRALSDYQTLDLPLDSDAVPSAYPLVASLPLRKLLVGYHVYVPRMWESWIDNPDADKESIEYFFSNHLVALPLDQRYEGGDMRELVDLVKLAWREANE